MEKNKMREKMILISKELADDPSFSGEFMALGYDWDEHNFDNDLTKEIMGFAFEVEGIKYLILDSSEPEAVKVSFENLGYVVEQKQIRVNGHRTFDVADPKVKAAVELKRKKDFENSLNDGRLFTQATKAFYSKARNALIISGEHFTGNDEYMHRLLGAMASLAMQYRVPVMHVKNDKDAAYLAARCIEKGANPKVISPSYEIITKELKRQAQQLAILMAIDLISEKSAKNLLSKFKTVRNVMNATDKELLSVDLIGKGKVISIRNAFEEEYEEPEEKITLENPPEKLEEITTLDNVEISTGNNNDDDLWNWN